MNHTRDDQKANTTWFCVSSNRDSVRRRSRELSGGEADAAVRTVEHGVEAFEERHAVDEVEAFAAGSAKVADDKVHAVGVAADRGVESAL